MKTIVNTFIVLMSTAVLCVMFASTQRCPEIAKHNIGTGYTMDHTGCANKQRHFNVAVKQHASCTGNTYAQNTHCSTTAKTLEKYTNHYSDIRCTSTVVSKDTTGTIQVRTLSYTQCNWKPSDNENQGD